MNCYKTFKPLIQTVMLLAILVPSIALAADDGTSVEKGFFVGQLAIGYRAVNAQDEHRRAVEYTLLESGPTANIELKSYKNQRHFYLHADYLDDSEYRGEAQFDYRGLLRLALFDESLYHNLEHFPYDSQSRPDAIDPIASVTFEDADPSGNYHVQVEQRQASLRAKLPSYPAHVNLAYWQLERRGKKQLRYLDESCTGCHMHSRSQNLDRVTEEVSGGIDAHLGPVDIILEQLFRQFRDRQSIPVDTFQDHMLRSGPASRQHDESPDSRLIESTIKLHTSLSGGVVGAASFSIGERENRSDLSDVRPIKSEMDFRKAAGDLTYIPDKKWTFNFRYRLLDLDSSNNSQISADGLVLSGADHNPVDVRDNIDLTRAFYFAAVAYRPSRKLTFKGEFQREEIHRGNTGGPEEMNAFANPIEIDPVWELPKDENINRYRLAVLAKPLGYSKLKLKGWYEYRTSDDPAYGNSAENEHQGFAGLTWNPTPRVGFLANFRVVQEDNNDIKRFQDDGVGGFASYELDRRNERQVAAAGLTLTPLDALSLSLNYGYLRSRIVQDLLFGMDTANGLTTKNADVEYSQRVHTLNLAAAWKILRNLRGLVEARYIKSFSHFDPDFPARVLTFSGGEVRTVSSDGLKELSEVDIRQAGLSLGLDWSPSAVWTCSALYTYDDYEDRDNDLFDGNVQTYMASVSRSW